VSRSFGLIDFAFDLEPRIAGQATDGVFGSAFNLIRRAFNMFLVDRFLL
jgi:hypothetical protein